MPMSMVAATSYSLQHPWMLVVEAMGAALVHSHQPLHDIIMKDFLIAILLSGERGL